MMGFDEVNKQGVHTTQHKAYPHNQRQSQIIGSESSHSQALQSAAKRKKD